MDADVAADVDAYMENDVAAYVDNADVAAYMDNDDVTAWAMTWQPMCTMTWQPRWTIIWQLT
jgi:hypothetical protein